MKLKRLEIQGFKSFAEKTVIDFEDGTTAIVGPNGSGKSNISDAVRWVLGEQSAKQLRGAKMEDVIFGGTEKRRAHTWCEVSLLFDNGDRSLKMDCAEVLVTRRVWRNGDSEYYLNKAACRLKDITELFRDTGIGKDGYSLIGQGRIDEILNVKSDDRREVFEEAAGIVTYRARKNEAERRMTNTRQNLERVEDILSELESQLAPLAQQAEDAKAYLTLRDTLKTLELNAFLLHHDRHKQTIQRLETLLADLDMETDAGEKEAAQLSAKRQALSDRLDAADGEEAAHNAQVLAAARAVEAQEGSNNVLRERIKSGEAAARREAALSLEAADRAQALEALRQENRIEAAGRAETYARGKEALLALEASGKKAQREVAQREAALETHKTAIIAAMNRMSDMKTERARLSALRQGLEGRLLEAEQSAAHYESGRKTLVDAAEGAQAALFAAKGELAALEAEAKALDEGVQAASQQYDALLESLKDRTAKRHQAASRLKVLKEMERDYEGYQHAVRQALLHARDNEKVHGVVASILKTPKTYELALDMVLGAALQQIITQDEHTAKEIIEYLRLNRFGRATFLPLNTVRGRTLTPQERQVLTLPGCLGVASELVAFDPKYRPIVESLLGRTVIAEDLDSGIAIMRQGRHAFRLVTLGGDVMHSGGSISGGSVQSRMTSLLSREREIEEHGALLTALTQEIEDTQARIDALDKERAELKRKRNALFDKAHQAEIAVARDTEHAARAQAELAAHDGAKAQAETLAEQIHSNLQDINAQLSLAEAHHEDGAIDQAGMQQETAALQAALSAARAGLDALREEETQARVALAAQERELSALVREGERLGREESQLSGQQSLREAEREEKAKALQRDLEALAAGEAALTEKNKALEAIREAQQQVAAARQALLLENRTLTERLEALRETLAQTGEKRHRTELQLVRAQNDLKNLTDRIWNDYELTYAGAMEAKVTPFDLKESEKAIASIRGEIRNMGPVNVNAVENYRLTKERYDHLSEQKEDLLKATADLTGIIEELLQKMERRFRKRFAMLNTFFGETFAMLFGGGHAALTLADEKDILNCAIDVVAQPPGKKLQLLTLLSGGERALTAIAILFAMLQLKPTPFCILDEIEAALDEANVANFADYLNDFSKHTQFVVVTHRRGTMERCQALYGVAMEEKGVSRMVSVKLSEAGA